MSGSMVLNLGRDSDRIGIRPLKQYSYNSCLNPRVYINIKLKVVFKL